MTDEQIKRHVSANLQRILAEQDISPYRLAKDLGEPLNTMYRIVRGDNLAGAGILSRIADRLGTTVDELISQPEKNPPKSLNAG